MNDTINLDSYDYLLCPTGSRIPDIAFREGRYVNLETGADRRLSSSIEDLYRRFTVIPMKDDNETILLDIENKIENAMIDYNHSRKILAELMRVKNVK